MYSTLFQAKNSVQIEIMIPKNTSTNQLVFNFPDQPFLRDKKITAIYLSVADYTVASGTLNVGKDIVSNATPTYLLNTSIFLTLQNDKGMQIIQNQPLVELNPFNSNPQSTAPDQGLSKFNVDGIMEIEPQTIVWTKSYISAPTPILATAVFDRAFQFTVFYELN